MSSGPNINPANQVHRVQNDGFQGIQGDQEFS